MYKVSIEIPNSVNDDVYEKVKFFSTKEDAERFIEENEKEVDEWNKPDGSPFGGRMSTRYFSYELEEVNRDTVMDGMTFGDLANIIYDLVNKTYGNVIP